MEVGARCAVLTYILAFLVDLTVPTAKVTAVILIAEVPAKAADTAESPTVGHSEL